jgi:light-regulated signal transduction histidine kinase (bacteriophytochrome)
MLPLVAGEKEPTFYIEDNGIGIDKKFFIDIFKIFKRLHPRDEYGGGTGSGLTFAKKIIEEWGGTIWLLSELNEGTAFYFTLGPSAKGKETEEPRREPKIASPSQHH